MVLGVKFEGINKIGLYFLHENLFFIFFENILLTSGLMFFHCFGFASGRCLCWVFQIFDLGFLRSFQILRWLFDFLWGHSLLGILLIYTCFLNLSSCLNFWFILSLLILIFLIFGFICHFLFLRLIPSFLLFFGLK